MSINMLARTRTLRTTLSTTARQSRSLRTSTTAPSPLTFTSRPIKQSGGVRSYASSSPSSGKSNLTHETRTVTTPNTSARTATIVALLLAGLGGAAYYFQERGGLEIRMLPVPMAHGGNKGTEHGVLDQKSLKEPGLHSKDGPSPSHPSGASVKKTSAPGINEFSSAPSGSSSSGSSEPDAAPSSVTDKAAEASKPSEGAFNEETGEINWDCPCLGGMADGPCGEQFKAAFSCFVFSEAEPKGVDCVDKFKLMQDCFREHPDVYGEEIIELEDDDESDVTAPAAQSSGDASAPQDDLSHPIPGNPTGDTRTPAQRERGAPGKPTDIPPENSAVFTAHPDNSPKKGPKHVEK